MGMARRYSVEQIEFIRRHAKNNTRTDLTELFNKKFDESITVGAMNSLMKNRKIKIGIRETANIRRNFTVEEQAFIREHNPGRYNKELTDLLNQKFNKNYSEQQVKSWKKREKLVSGIDAKYKKGQVPLNKGTKGMFNVGGNSTSFKKGVAPHNVKPIGSETIRYGGYRWIKVAEDPPVWKAMHVLEWEKHHGKVKEGHVLIFLDGNKQNIDISNLKMVTRAENTRMNQYGYRSTDPELTSAGILQMKLRNKLTQLKRGTSDE